MRTPVHSSYVCSFPDFDDVTVVGIDAATPRQAAEQAAAWWERDIEDWRVREGQETLRVRVETGKVVSHWEVLGVEGRYMAKVGEIDI